MRVTPACRSSIGSSARASTRTFGTSLQPQDSVLRASSGSSFTPGMDPGSPSAPWCSRPSHCRPPRCGPLTPVRAATRRARRHAPERPSDCPLTPQPVARCGNSPVAAADAMRDTPASSGATMPMAKRSRPFTPMRPFSIPTGLERSKRPSRQVPSCPDASSTWPSTSAVSPCPPAFSVASFPIDESPQASSVWLTRATTGKICPFMPSEK